MTKSYKSLFFILVVLLLLLVLVSLNLGQMNISLSQIVNVFDLNSDAVIRDVILNLRLPRILFAALVGCGLALCGYDKLHYSLSALMAAAIFTALFYYILKL